MSSHISQRVRHGFTLIEILIVVVILGILAAIVIPQFTDAAGEANRSNLQSQLQTIRSQIELHNVQNPATAYDATAAVGTFWDRLIQNNYLQTLPKNPIVNGSPIVGAGPAAGVGWIWAEATAGQTWSLNIYAADPNETTPAGWFDGDGDGAPD